MGDKTWVDDLAEVVVDSLGALRARLLVDSMQHAMKARAEAGDIDALDAYLMLRRVEDAVGTLNKMRQAILDEMARSMESRWPSHPFYDY